jgi:hypothetical protein
MDPQATWNELLESYSRKQFEEALAAAENLHQWLQRGGFPPTVTAQVSVGDELHRVIAWAVVQHVLACCK